MEKMRNNLKELSDVLEEIRQKEYPDIPKELITEIINSQYEEQDNRSKARNSTFSIIAKYLNDIEK